MMKKMVMLLMTMVVKDETMMAMSSAASIVK